MKFTLWQSSKSMEMEKYETDPNSPIYLNTAIRN